MRIGTDIFALKASRHLSQTSKAIARAMERLSTGKRINSARDDIATLSSTNRLEAQRRGVTQAIRNINEARSLFTVADNALAQQQDIVQRMNELAMRASNGTLTSAERETLNTEFQNLVSDIDKIAQTTYYADQRLLQNNLSLDFQVGAGKLEQVRFNINASRVADLFQEIESDTTRTYSGTYSSRSTFTIAVPSGGPTTLVSTDLDNDGDIDIVYRDADNSHHLLFNDGNGSFTLGTTYSSSGLTDIDFGDINGDGYVDMVTAGTSANISIYLNNGNGTFGTATTIATTGAAAAGKVKLSDLDGDNDLDIVFQKGGMIGTFRNGSGVFSTLQTTATSVTTPRDFISADVDGDGFKDIVTYGNNIISLAYGNGDGTFTTAVTATGGGTQYKLAVADVNGDGRSDIVTDSMSVYLGRVDRTLVSFSTFAGASGNAYGVTLVDYNNDGKLDYLSTSTPTDLTYLILGNGNGTFSGVTTFSTPASTGLLVRDFNGDNQVDIIVTSFGEQTYGSFLSNYTEVTTESLVLQIDTQENAENTLTTLLNAMENLKENRANLAAVHSRLNSMEAYSLILKDNLQEAESSRKDADIAQEVAELVRMQILQDIQIAVLTQANLNRSMVSKLLDSLR